MPDSRYGYMAQDEYEARRAAEVLREIEIKAERDACGQCDEDGYRGYRVCDHIDRTEIVARGLTKVRAALKGKS